MSRNRHMAAATSLAATGGAGDGRLAVQPGPLQLRRRSADTRAASVLDLGILLIAGLAVLAMLTMSPALLTHWNIHYATSGGSFYEKLHPATYLVVIALGLALLRTGNPVDGLVEICARSKPVLFYFVCWLFLVVQTLMLDRPFTVVVDTFLLPVLLALAIWQVTASGRRRLALLVHLLILMNVAIGYYEYFTGSRIIPLTVGDVLVLGEWRSAALIGHPLNASGLIAAYILALVLRPQVCPPPWLRLPLIALCLGSLMVFGGRTALVTTLLIIAIWVAAGFFRVMRGGRVSLPSLIVGIGIVFAGIAAILAILDLGVFDKMLLRFSSDRGSALARLATLDMLSHLDWNEVLLGPAVSRANALQHQLGLDYGIENFWIASIVQFGMIHTALMTAALIAFFGMLLRRSSPAAIAVVTLITIIAASSVSFSSKNIQMAQFVLLVTVMLPRTVTATAPQSASPYMTRSSARAMHARSAS